MASLYTVLGMLLAWYTFHVNAANVYQLHASYIDDNEVYTLAARTAVTAQDASVCSRRTTVVQITVTEIVYGSSTSLSGPSSDGVHTGSLPSALGGDDNGTFSAAVTALSSTSLRISPSSSNSGSSGMTRSSGSSSFHVPGAMSSMTMPLSYYTGSTASFTTIYSGSVAIVEGFQPYSYMTRTSDYSGSLTSFSTILPSSGSSATVIEYLPTGSGANGTILTSTDGATSTSSGGTNSSDVVPGAASTNSAGSSGISIKPASGSESASSSSLDSGANGQYSISGTNTLSSSASSVTTSGSISSTSSAGSASTSVTSITPSSSGDLRSGLSTFSTTSTISITSASSTSSVVFGGKAGQACNPSSGCFPGLVCLCSSDPARGCQCTSTSSSNSASSNDPFASTSASASSSISLGGLTTSTATSSSSSSSSSSVTSSYAPISSSLLECPPMPVNNSDFSSGLSPWTPTSELDSNNAVAPSTDGHDDAASMQFSLNGGDPSPVSLAQQVDTCQNTTYAVSFWYNQNTPEDAATNQSFFTVSVDGVAIMSMHGGSPDGSMNSPIGQWYKSRPVNFTATSNSSLLEMAVNSTASTPVSILVDDFGMTALNSQSNNTTNTTQNLLYDGDFSLADMSTDTFNLVGWTWGTNGNMNLKVSTIFFGQYAYAYFASGGGEAKISGSAVYMGCERDDAYVFLSQTITTTPGSLYVATFWYWILPGDGPEEGTAQLHIRIDGATIWSASTMTTSGGWQQASMTFVAGKDTTLFEVRWLCQPNNHFDINVWASDFSVTLGDDSAAPVCSSQPLSNAGFQIGLNSWTTTPNTGAITSSEFADGTPAADMMCTSNETVTLSQAFTASPGASYRVVFSYWIDPHYATESNPAAIVVTDGLETISTWTPSSNLPIDGLGNSIGNHSVPDLAYFIATSVSDTFELSLVCSGAPMHVQIASIQLEMAIDESSVESILPNGNFSQGIAPWETAVVGNSSIDLIQSGFDDNVSLFVTCNTDDSGNAGSVSLSQTVQSIAGYNYALSYWFIQEIPGGAASSVSWALFANDAVVGTVTGANQYDSLSQAAGFWFPSWPYTNTFAANSNSTTISWVLSCPASGQGMQMQIDNFVLRPTTPGYAAWTETDDANEYPLSQFSGDFEAAQFAPWVTSRSGNGNYATLTSPGDDDSTQAALLYCTDIGAAAIAQSFDTTVNAYYEVKLEYLANCTSGNCDGILQISTDRQYPDVTSPPLDGSWTSLLITIQASTTFTELSLHLSCQGGSDNTMLIDNVMVTPTIIANGEMTEYGRWWQNNPYSNYNATGQDDASSYGMICQDNEAAIIQQNILLASPSGNPDYQLQFSYQHWDWSVTSKSGTDIPPLFEMWLDGILISAFTAGSPFDSNDDYWDGGWQTTTAPIHMAYSTTQHSLQLVLQCAGIGSAISANFDVVSIEEQQQSAQILEKRQTTEQCPIVGDNLITNGDFECDSNTIADWIVVGAPSLRQSGCCQNGIQSAQAVSMQCDPSSSEDVSIQQKFTTESRQQYMLLYNYNINGLGGECLVVTLSDPAVTTRTICPTSDGSDTDSFGNPLGQWNTDFVTFVAGGISGTTVAFSVTCPASDYASFFIDNVYVAATVANPAYSSPDDPNSPAADPSADPCPGGVC